MGAGRVTMHFHGTPITPKALLNELAGHNFCVSFAAPEQVKDCHQLGQSVMLDNGAFSFWRTGKETDWDGYYKWCERWLDYRTTWAVIPDVIDGSEEENDALIRQWPFGDRGAPVWHLNESIERLTLLAQFWPRICFGSSGAYSQLGSPQWHRRMEQAFNALCGNGPCPVWTHMLRGMAMVEHHYPFASVDSTDVARNHNRPQNTAVRLARRWDGIQTPARWSKVEQLELA